MAIFYRVPRPDGKGHIYFGELGVEKFETLAELVLELDNSLAQRVGLQQARDKVIDIFIKLLLIEGCEVNQETASRLLQETSIELRKSLVVIEHYLPCILFPVGGPDEFSIGPVTFSRRAKFFRERRVLLKNSIKEKTAAHINKVNLAVSRGYPRNRAYSEKQSEELVRKTQISALKKYREYKWIASVKVIDCDENISRKRAVRVIDMVLHIVRILFRSEPTRNIRSAWSQIEPSRTAHLYADTNEVIHVGLASRTSEAIGVENWYEVLMQGNRALNFLGSSLRSIVDPKEACFLSQRVIDAINWFGDAATDLNPSSSIVKHVSAIERLFFGKFSQGRTKIFAERVQKILEVLNCDDRQDAYEQAITVYKARSALVHGEYSPSEYKINQLAHTAESLSRMCLLCATEIYPMLLAAFENPGSVELEKVMQRISSEGLDWLADLAGFKKE